MVFTADEEKARSHRSEIQKLNEIGMRWDNLRDISWNRYYEAAKAYGLGVYEVERMIKGINKPFNDGAHIIYVNGAYRGNDAVGKLMHDFSCTQAEDMNYSLMADGTNYLKVNPEGVAKMCKQMEDLRDKSRAEGAMAKAKAMTLELHALGVDIDKIAKAAQVSVEQINAWLAEGK